MQFWCLGARRGTNFLAKMARIPLSLCRRWRCYRLPRLVLRGASFSVGKGLRRKDLRAPLRKAPLELADLQSRLEWGPVFRLHALTEADKGSVFAFRARQRGLRLTPEAVEYVMRRAPRDMTSLLALLDTLDKASLAQQRSLSVPFIRDALGW